MFNLRSHFRQAVAELKKRRYSTVFCAAPFVSMEGTLEQDRHYHTLPEKIEGPAFDLGQFFVGRDRYLWLEKEVVLPESKEGWEVGGLFDFGDSGPGNTYGFESWLYVDGQLYQGVDTNHQEILFQGREGKPTRLTFLLWTGLEGGGAHRTFHHQCRQADIVYLNKKADELYFFAKAITETLERLPREDACCAVLSNALDRALKCISWDDDLFFPSAEEAHAVLMAELVEMEKHTDVTVNMVGHTHIDVAWLWRLKHTREKAQRSFSTALRMMERYDEFVFLQSQPQLYKYIREDCPELYQQIRQRVAEGKWEVDGGMWIEADCNLLSGESLVRQFLYGTRFIEQEFGKKCEHLWLPDVFGFSWALPQIMAQCGIHTLSTTKLGYNEYNEIPNDLFKWRGVDGTEVMAYFVNTPVPEHPFDSLLSTYSADVIPYSILGSWTKFKNKELSRENLVAYGFGDGGGGVTRDMLEMRRVLDRLPGLPHLKPTSAGAFFRKLHEQLEQTDRYVPVWDGELYLECHRGTYTSQAYSKKTNRYMETALTQTEWLSSLAYLAGGSYPAQALHDSWETVLLHQFHDIIPGSSIREVYEDSHINYAAAQAQMHSAKNAALAWLTAPEDHTYSIWSTNSFAGTELVQIPETGSGVFTDRNGHVLESQKNSCGHLVQVRTVPFGVTQVRFLPQPADVITPECPFLFEENKLDTPFYHLEWNDAGQLTQIFDKKAGRPILRDGQYGNVLEMYEDKADAWNVNLIHTQKKEIVPCSKKPELLEIGPLKAAVRFEYRYHHSSIVQDMIVYRDCGRIDFSTYADWHEKDRLLKTVFYTDIRSTKATYDIPFGSIERPTHWNTSWDWARFEVCGHKWADLSEKGYGISLLNDCKYGYSAKDNALALSLLRSPKYPDLSADMGEHTFCYSLYPHQGDHTEGGTLPAANQLNLPAQVIAGVFKEPRRPAVLTGDGVQLDAIKKAEDEDCLIVRLHECCGGRTEATLSSEFPVKKIIPCDLLERDTGEAVEAAQVHFTARPFEIKTFKLYF